MPANLKRARDFVEDPKNLLGVLKHLISDDKVDLPTCKRQGVALNICHANSISLPYQILGVLDPALYSNKRGLRVDSSHNLQIPSCARSPIGDNLQTTQAVNKFFNHVRPISFPLVSKSAQRMRTAGAAEQRLGFWVPPHGQVLRGKVLLLPRINSDIVPRPLELR
jgi:hypothetical protein